MKVIDNAEGVEVLKSKGVTGIRLTQSDKVETVELTLEPGTRVENHSLPIDVVFYPVEGTALLTGGPKPVKVAPGQVVEVEPGENRGFHNNGSTRFRVLVIKIS